MRIAKKLFESKLPIRIKDRKKFFVKKKLGTGECQRKSASYNQCEDMGNTVPMDEEKAEVQNAFFASAFNSQMGSLEAKQSPELAHREGSTPDPL